MASPTDAKVVPILGGNAPSISNIHSIPKNSGHRVSALYPNLVAAKQVRKNLLASGFAEQAIRIRHKASASASVQASQDDLSDDVINEVVADSAIGAAVGAGIGAIGTVILIASSETLFIASPLIAPLALIGHLAAVGGLLGGTLGAADKTHKYSDVVEEAIRAGNVLLQVHTYSPTEIVRAKEIIQESLKEENQKIKEFDYPEY